MRGATERSFQTETGLPQGSVLSPVLFLLFISDIYKDIESQNVKFADDGTVWRTGSDIKRLAEEIEVDLKKIAGWTKKWRMKINVEKTEYCIFSRKVEDRESDLDIKLNDKNIKKSSAPKLLGVKLDDKLNFQAHIEEVERKALKAAAALHIVGKSEQVSADNMIKLYRSLVLPHLEYAASVWQIGDCERLNKVQRKCLAVCLGTPVTSGIDALEVEAQVTPLDLRREDLAVRELTKIMAKENNQKIAECFQNWQVKIEEQHEKYLSPFGMAFMQLNDTISTTGINLSAIEPEFSFLQDLQPSKQRPEYWNNLGSSKSRSVIQEEEARKVIEGIVTEAESETVFVFTDGSCKGNPGPCGAGACLFFPNQEKIELHQPVAKRASILLGELVAIKMTLEYVKTEVNKREIKQLSVLSDSQSAVGILTLGWQNKSHTRVVAEVQQTIKNLEDKGIKIEINWTPGHAEIEGNEIADRLAKQGADEAEEMPEVTEAVTILDVKAAIRESGFEKWQQRWEASSTGRHLFEFRESVRARSTRSTDIKIQKIITQLRTGYCTLNEYKHKTGLKDSPDCICGETESVRHYIEDCELYESVREKLRVRLFQSGGIFQFKASVFLEVLKEDPYEQERINIMSVLEDYIRETKRFEKN